MLLCMLASTWSNIRGGVFSIEGHTQRLISHRTERRLKNGRSNNVINMHRQQTRICLLFLRVNKDSARLLSLYVDALV